MIKRKLILSCSFILATLCSTCIGLATYFVISYNMPENVTVNPGNITVSEQSKSFLSYAGVSKSIYTYDNDIIDDKFSINFSFNQNVYLNSSEIGINSGLGAKIKFKSSSLFNHVKNNVGFNFINFTYNQYELKMNNDTDYSANNQNCIIFDEDNTCTFHIAMSNEKSTNGFYLQKIAADNNLLRGQTVVGGEIVDNIWNFNMNFNFNIVDNNIGYSSLYDKTQFSSVEITLLFENYR